jgi:hypothetical protein
VAVTDPVSAVQAVTSGSTGSTESPPHAVRPAANINIAAQQSDRVVALRVTRFVVNLLILDAWNLVIIENKMPRTGRSAHTSDDVVMSERLRSQETGAYSFITQETPAFRRPSR